MTRKVCVVEGCDGEHRARGFCNAHYYHWRVGHDPHEVAAGRRPPGRLCEVCNVRYDRRGDGGRPRCYLCLPEVLRRVEDDRPMILLDQVGRGRFRCAACAVVVDTADVFAHRCEAAAA